MMRSLLVGSFLGNCLLLLGHSHPESACGQDSEQVTAQKVPFRIAKETTYIIEPLTESGLVDYAAYLNREMSQGVTPENNAAVLYWKAIGKNEQIHDNPEFFEKMKSALGTDPFSDGGPSLVSVGKIAEDLGVEVDFNEEATLGKQYQLAMDRPWTVNEAPLIQRWLNANEKPLETILEATKRPYYFRPLVGFGVTDPMMEMLLPDIQQFRDITRMLKARALLSLGEKRPENAIRDLLAIHRLARHSARGATMIEMLVGIAIDSVALDGDLQLANSEAATAEQLASYAKQLSELPPPIDELHCYQTERFYGLDIVQRLATQQLSGSEEDVGTGLADLLDVEIRSKTVRKLMSLFFQHGVDWNQVLIGFNDYHDKLQEALQQESYSAQSKDLKALQSSLDEQVQNLNSATNLSLAVFATPEQRGQQMRAILLGLLAPAIEPVHEAGMGSRTKADLSRIGVALAAYQKRNGEFPKSLDALVPRYLPKLPNDPYTGKPFVYRIDKKGALIYSLGKNLKDDAGKTIQEDHENHDHVFRVKRK